ncbi:hypothetical protein GLOIN_2v1669608 [Rhizophagus clarus]|uniref:F-box domain-containing protein n=1 Tax=Rhizophagus clarus TaxID=94130 RepID=A0A8H3L2L8_9GLOM|nr:hypothetical protein GLOIN_2v1669608 [Rhizophagus clarus]
MVSKLPNECLQQIFRDIEDINTLYSIIQVDHTWCENGIIYLWKNPFRNDVVNLKNQIKIIPILLTFLKKGENTLFDYPSLITHLNLDNLFNIVSEFSRLNNNLFKTFLVLMEKDDSLSFIFRNIKFSEWSELGQIWVINLLILVYIAKRKASIRWFKIDNNYAYFESLDRMEIEDSYHHLDNGLDQYYNITSKIEDIFKVFLRFDESKKFFENLEYLECGQLNNNNLSLDYLSKICRKLKTIRIEGDFRLIYKPLVSLNKFQKNLEILQIIGVKNNSGMWFYEKNIFEIFSSLEFISHSLKRFEISGIEMMTDETFEFLGNCKNLEILRLEDSNISHKNFEWIAKAELPKLHSLELISNWDGVDFMRQINPIQGILKNKLISSNLKKLYLRNKFLKNYDLLDAISENCRNLVHFSTQLTANNDITTLFTILENNSNLKELYLNIYLDMHTVDISTEVIIDLAKSLPESIDTVQLELLINCVYYCRIFLENCSVNLKYLYIIISIDNDAYDYMNYIERWSSERGKKVKLSYRPTYTDFYDKIDVIWDENLTILW